MSWTRPEDLKDRLRRLWERGELLRALAADETLFPLRLTIRGPTSAELTHRFEAARAWTSSLTAMPRVRVEWREVNHRLHGAQRQPVAVWLDTLDDALVLIGKRGEATRFKALLAATRARRPELVAWLAKRPLQTLDLADVWDRLLAVVDWIAAHPRSGVYLRQVDIPGVHSKFIESQRAVLAEWLDIVLPPEAIDASHSGGGQFTARYGFRDKPSRIRFRFLDPAIDSVFAPGADITLDADSFARLRPPVRAVLITENEVNFLALPSVRDAMVVFGAGYGWNALARADWLNDRAIHYWGDIDTHGFAILDQLRSRLSHVRSFLMDRGTLLAHQAFWGQETTPIAHDLNRLTPTERALFDDLRDNRLGQSLRLEQERIGFQKVTAALTTLPEREPR